MKINIIFIIMLVQFFVNCLSAPVDKYMEGLGKFCGSKLAIELSILCKGKYNEARGNVNRRPKRGIIEECCLTSCTRKFLKDNYCASELTVPKIKQTMEKPTTSSKIKNKTKQKIDYFSVLFNLAWNVGEEVGMISIPSDHQQLK
ncbi:insulin-like growth factor II [Rhopalosiphum padi]|uniref:insulin-like growth factor II n=1 Tax=Rhopalosiphum padi TaxID=40932 RepID=UPI00298D85E6|nr:insulin-like growth factor II [Rhopalosiphum padi]